MSANEDDFADIEEGRCARPIAYIAASARRSSASTESGSPKAWHLRSAVAERRR
jgi:hypothetical protein